MSAPNPANWSCQIGEVDRAKLPAGSDLPMRRAVEAAFRELTGEEPQWIFSGWGDPLPEQRRAVLEHRWPDPTVIRDALMDELIPVENWIATHVAPWGPDDVDVKS